VAAVSAARSGAETAVSTSKWSPRAPDVAWFALALLKSSQFRGTAILAVGPAGILPADKCAKATGKMPIFPTAKMAVPCRLARFSTKLFAFYHSERSLVILRNNKSCLRSGRHDKGGGPIGELTPWREYPDELSIFESGGDAARTASGQSRNRHDKHVIPNKRGISQRVNRSHFLLSVISASLARSFALLIG